MITLSRDDVRSLSHLDMVNGEWLDAEGCAVLLGQHPAKGVALVRRSHFPASKWEKQNGAPLWRVSDVHWWASRYTRIAEPRSDETCLYRHFDAAGRLLYVGISICLAQRTSSHRLRAEWFRDVRNITVEWFASREIAEAAELSAIRSEHPIHNVAGRQNDIGIGRNRKTRK